MGIFVISSGINKSRLCFDAGFEQIPAQIHQEKWAVNTNAQPPKAWKAMEINEGV